MNIPQYLYGENEDLQRYFALLVQQLQAGLSNNGWTIPQLNGTQVTLVTGAAFVPVLPPGTIWFNSSKPPNGKLQFITIQAIPASLPGGPVAATIETITSA